MNYPTLLTLIATLSLSSFLCAKESSLEEIASAVQAKKTDEALALAKRLIKKNSPPDGLPAELNKAAANCVARQDLKEAASFYQLVVDHFPNSKEATAARPELLGCYYMQRQLKKAITQAKQNLEAEPKSEWVEYWNFVIAQGNFRLWNFKLAEKQLTTFLQTYPNGQYSKYARKDLGNINPAWDIDKNGLIKYAGKLENDIRIHKAIKDLPEHIEVGFTMLQDRLGVDLRQNMNVLFLLQDSGPRTKGRVKASTYVVARDYKPTILMRFYSEFVAAQPENYRQTVIHEMKHAGFKGIMGQKYDDLPGWVKEGLAVYGSNDVQTRLQLVLSNTISAGKDPIASLTGIKKGDDEISYMEAALAFEWLESKGKGNVKKFCQNLVKGKPFQEIWTTLSGLPYEQALKESNAYTLKRVKTELGTALTEFKVLHKGYQKAFAAGQAPSKEWLDSSGREGFTQWLSKNPKHPAAPFARFSFAHSLFKAGEGEAGRKLLREILTKDGLRSTLRDDAQLWIGVSYNWERNNTEAKKAFGILLRDYPASSSAKQIKAQFQPAPPITK